MPLLPLLLGPATKSASSRSKEEGRGGGDGASGQVELHPYLSQDKLLRLCRQHGIALVGFSSLASASYVQLGMAEASDSLLHLPVLKALAEKHCKTPAQVVLRWAVQRGTAIIPVRGFVLL